MDTATSTTPVKRENSPIKRKNPPNSYTAYTKLRPASNNANISESLLNSSNVASPSALDSVSDTYSEVDTESDFSNNDSVIFLGAKYADNEALMCAKSASHEVAEQDITYIGHAKRQVIVRGKAGKSSLTTVDLTTTESIFEDVLGEFCYGDSAQAEQLCQSGGDEHSHQEMYDS
ncbi:hypothetical protein BT96DRAFT_1001688 [Gymnopus androsaceus JB14]|uniref:Uncharacterized protein n=1 Tax=Gymnopus androsaceus JB14 TaxID=1447944 RepID=A0A6A4GYT9_9AGAR|nr:hypothetical protein BT96DRAFT_1001688 [Gymnopus androsaceus JB14]